MDLHEQLNKVLEEVGKLEEQALAYVIITARSGEAHEYCQKYLMPQAWGKNIWYAVLDDAIRMRKELEKGNAKESSPEKMG